MKRLARIASPILQPRRGYVGPARASAFLGLGQTFPPLLPPPRLRLYSQHSTSSKICPSCGSGLDLAEISCTKCSSLCPLPEDINYLSLFGFHSQPPFEFDLDASKLRREYLRMMSKVHPDSVIDKSEVSRPSILCADNLGSNPDSRKCLINNYTCLFNSSKTTFSSHISTTSFGPSCSGHGVLEAFRPGTLNDSA